MVDKFLIENKIDIQDDGFTARVMQKLSEQSSVRELWHRRLDIIWGIFCIVALMLVCWKTNIITNMLYDIRMWFVTLPANIQDVNIWQTMATVYISTFIIVTILILKKYEKVF